MNNHTFFKAFLILILLAVALPSCDRMDDDVAPAKALQLTLINDFYSTIQNKKIEINPLGNDSISSQAVITLGSPAHGTLTASPAGNGILLYQPNTNYAGTDTFSYKACVGQQCARATVTIQVSTDPGLPPVCRIYAATDFLTLQQNTADTINIVANDTVCNAVVSISVPAKNGVAQLSNNGIVLYTPNANYTGLDSITYQLTDSSTTVSAKVRITVLAKPCVPKANPDNLTLVQGTVKTINVLMNDSICNVSPIITSMPQHGTATFIASGVLQYSASPTYTGSDEIEYQLTNANGTSKAKVNITVTPVPCIPTATIDLATLIQGTTISVNVLANDNACNTKPVITTTPQHGSAVVLSSGQVQYTANATYTGIDELEYQLTNANGTSKAKVRFTVTPVPCVPVAVNDVLTMPQGSIRIVNVLANDTDCNTTPVITKLPLHGSAMFVSRGMLRIVADTIYTGLEEVEYQLSNANGTSSAKVQFTVVSNCVVQAYMDSAAMNAQNDTITLDVLQNDNLCQGTSPVLTVTSQPANGVASMVSIGSRLLILYDKNTASQGPYTDIIQYRVCVNVNGVQQCSTSYIQLAVY